MISVVLKRMKQRNKVLSSERLAVFFEDIGNMFETGLSLKQILAAFRDADGKRAEALAAAEVAKELMTGISLAEALKKTELFPPIAVKSLYAGERAGQIPKVARVLAEYFKRMSELNQKLSSAWVYPCVVLTILVAVLVYMAIKVVPQLEQLLPPGSMNGFLTQTMISVAHMIKDFWFVWAGAFLWAAVFVRFNPLIVDRAISALPWFGAAKKDLELSVVFFTLAVLQKNGIPLEAALLETSHSVDGKAGEALGRARACLAGGLTFSEAVRRDSYFPRIVADTLKIGEETGRFDEYFERVYHFFYRSFLSRMDRLLSAVQPALFLFCALFIAAMAFAFLQPVYSNLTNIGR